MNELDRSEAAFFERKYQAATNHDPWNFAEAPYERQRYADILSALQGRRYCRAFEPGCSVGVLTQQLASICDSVFACDFSPTAVEVASLRCAKLPGVTLQCESLLASAAWHDFDLVVLCEIGYYFSPQDWRTLVEAMVRGMRSDTVLLACHWLGTSMDHVQTGDEVHAALEHPLLERTLALRREGFRLERWRRIA